MLRWAEDLTPQRKEEVLRFVKPYGDFLLAHQQPSGVIPSWYEATTMMTPRKEFRDFNAETAPSALLLVTLGNSTGDTRYVEAAERAMSFIEKEVLPPSAMVRFRDVPVLRAKDDYGFFDKWTAQYPAEQSGERCRRAGGHAGSLSDHAQSRIP